MYVREHMSCRPVTITAATSVAGARRILTERQFRHLPVVDGEGVLVGIVSDRDLRSCWPSGLGTDEERERHLGELETVPVRGCMTKSPRFLTPASTLDDALYILEKIRVGALPVIDEKKRVVGIFSVQDLMKAYRQLFGLGEEGSAFLEIDDDGSGDLPGRILAVLEESGVPLLRFVRRAGGEGDRGPVYLRVSTYNIHGLKEEFQRAGLACRQG